MPTKADRKHLDATVAAFHSNYASPSNWGHERWHDSLYPALSKPTRYAALVNQYVPRPEVDKVLAATSTQELRPIELPKLPSGVEAGAALTPPRILLLERMTPTTPAPENESACKSTKDDNFLFPPPQPTPTPSDLSRQLMTHWNMDAASALGAHMLDVQPGDRVLDLCAAPGGKSVALAQTIFPQLHASSPSPRPEALTGCLHSNEVDAARNKRLANNLRAYLPSALFATNAVRVLRLDAADARAVTQLPLGAGGYDKVLLDAPCSSERHIIHAHVKAAAGGRIADEMARWRKGSSKGLAKLQADILMTALRAVRVGGRVVYSTCSIEAGENDGVVQKMLATVEKEQKKFGLPWDVRIELGREKGKEGESAVDEALEKLSEETRYGRIAVPDIEGGGQWGPLFFCVITKVPRKA
ncbi:Bacterial Fmu (Sun)/eukaryotic nucleolar NOL1/Nop2p [Macrophomina phaseolina MS6]|uniref:NOL1/NOP2/Sun domain family member 4 n=1 Tax=Macrophomina phaseolina (strain MS6) TaxID=1126212 RepID=K2SHP9_MACPH|nr:Bacterial Fmu (Sun)/eukaryotic nucleolar NOL1/Nop2p [Macrophomina phaseolina MS6]